MVLSYITIVFVGRYTVLYLSVDKQGENFLSPLEPTGDNILTVYNRLYYEIVKKSWVDIQDNIPYRLQISIYKITEVPKYHKLLVQFTIISVDQIMISLSRRREVVNKK